MNKRLALGLAVVGLGLSIASGARALAVTVADATFGDANTSGSVLGVDDLSGSVSTLAGTVTNPTDQDWLIFKVSLDSGSDPVDEIGAAVPFITPLGIGFFDDTPGEDPTGASSLDVANGIGFFDYDHLNVSATNLEALEMTDRLVVAFAKNSLLNSAFGEASFMISSGANFFVDSPTRTVVPEPGTMLLFASALWVAHRRRSRRRA